MSFTVGDMFRNVGNFLLRANPITGPAFLAKDFAESEAGKATAKYVKDTTAVAVDSTVKAARAVGDAGNAVLNYDLEKGAHDAGDAIAYGYNATVDATVEAADDYVVKPTVAAGKAIGQGANDAYDATVNAANDYVVNPTVQAVEELDKGQKSVRRGIADWIAPD